MTEKEAYQILGLPPGSQAEEIKKKYRKLMIQVHPDAGIREPQSSAYHAHEINEAYSFLKKRSGANTKNEFQSKRSPSSRRPPNTRWNAPVNKNAYREREILQYAEDAEGSILGNFCIDRGKYLWTVEEDFPLFLLSIYRCSGQLLDEIDEALSRRESPAVRHDIQTELVYFLTQQFIAGTDLLKELAKEEKSGRDKGRIFYLSAMLESSDITAPPETGEFLYPFRLRKHRLYLKRKDGREAGYLSFSDDRLYYIVIPLFEQKAVQVKIQVSEKQPYNRPGLRYQNLHLWLRLSETAAAHMPENLNLQIELLLQRYAEFSASTTRHFFL